MATKTPASDLQTRFPRLAERLPDGFVNGVNVVYAGWRRLGYFKYLIAAVVMWFIPDLLEAEVLPILEARFGTTVLFESLRTVFSRLF
jgi:hypothetical protein